MRRKPGVRVRRGDEPAVREYLVKYLAVDTEAAVNVNRLLGALGITPEMRSQSGHAHERITFSVLLDLGYTPSHARSPEGRRYRVYIRPSAGPGGLAGDVSTLSLRQKPARPEKAAEMDQGRLSAERSTVARADAM